MKRFNALLFAFCFAVFALSTPARAAPFSQIVVFGDSLSDAGNVFLASGQSLPASPPYFNGRFSNGPVWIDDLATALGVPVPLPSAIGGTNNAWAGAQLALSGLSVQSTPNVGTQIAAYLSAHPALTPNQLVVLWGGSNDFIQFPAIPLPVPATLVANVTAEITQLAQAGAHTFLVPNLAALGETPYVKQQLEPVLPGIEVAMNALVSQYNALLLGAESTLEATLGIDIIPLDVHALFAEVLANAAQFGFTNVSDQAKSGPTGVPGAVVPNPDQYVFWDPVHPTRVIHQMLGIDAANAVAAAPEPATWLLLASGLFVLTRSRRARSS